ncbi:MAG: Rrf2 family transcriptional regulator [Bacteroidia bacterium]|nr:Rrf2 family transcriptional regulator [Bacteroidia bacterium]NND26276.1 Rrf2 family transcriptional regulator [Flavobacteriaceae bacterium]MBT8278525.1 Rrf2 family transcriptional regulator [Bacteroidia bacterium]NNK61226.1 Rrf2 family transcriptional regulator [Flavobacteriaceae bacterium]NNL33319.1 Rrf2 family transcriptional regulator [Flavobacteriaceae bacterium]
MLSNSAKYAFKSVLFLALNSNAQKRIMAKDLAESIQAPKAYVSKILQELSRQNIISSVRGPKGGFYLSTSNLDGYLIGIVLAMDGEKKLHSCVLGLEKCNEEQPCPLHDVIHPTRSRFLAYLNSETILEFTKKYPKDDQFFE